MSSNVARVEYDSAGTLGLLVEAAGTNLLLRYLAIDDAAWSDVGTPTLTTGQTDPFGATGAVKVDDNDAAAFEGRSQAVTVSAGAAYFMHCYVKAGTATKARISIDGTTQDISGLSATTWSIVEKGDASSSGVSIAVQVLVGNAVTDTGTVIFGGCDVKAGTYRTSIVPTAGVAVARAAELATMVIPSLSATNGCLAGTVQYPGGNADKGWLGLSTVAVGGFRSMLYEGAAANAVRLYVNATADDATTTTAGTRRMWGYWSAAGTGVCVDGSCVTSAGNTETGAPDRFNFCTYGNDSSKVQDCLISRVMFDPTPTRCGL